MFKLILKMAWKNSFVRPVRTLLVVLMIAISMGMMLGIEGLYDGMSQNMAEKNKRSDSGDISIFAKDYRINKELKFRIQNAAKIEEELQKNPQIRSLVLRLSADGLVSTARKSSFAQARGIDLDDEEAFGKFSEFLEEGELLLGDKNAIIGIELAKTLKVNVGSKVVFSTQDSSGEINSIALKISAIVQTSNIILDNNALFIDKKKMFAFLGVDAKDATQIAIASDDAKLLNILKTKYPTLDVKSFFELQPMMQMMEDMMVIFNSITFFIIMSVVFVGIFGVMYVSVLDRIREFGIMLAVGMEYKYIRLQIYFEAIFVGLIGFFSGSLLGLLLLIYLRDYGLDFSAFADALQSWGYETIIYGTIKLSYFTTTFLAIMSASVLSVIIPLRKIKNLNPIEVIKAEK
ncbi:MAG: ABC transporter permease [Sulfurimonas sp.]|nr:ABC transporter permease [Sulfurimonas sp.]MBU3940234.1 FtsX-like permease family protein [bacterium]MBU4024090.1 FtsX-like permease family protein [bacterium]MBU4058082.1 FtsX-like permease family protein [bacterium]MBU4110457.1 FtsX-like permease family protein [bacterium]